MGEWIEVEPAYGREYSSQKAVKNDWDAEKDFRIRGTSTYTNKPDAERYGLKVNVYYANGMKIFTVKSK